MKLFEVPTEVAEKQKKIVKTSLVGYCYGCQTFHYKGEQYQEGGKTWCKHTGSLVDTTGFHPPIPVEIPQSWLDAALAGPDAMVEVEDDLPTLTEQITAHMEDLADLFGIDTQKHQARWNELVSQMIALAEGEVSEVRR